MLGIGLCCSLVVPPGGRTHCGIYDDGADTNRKLISRRRRRRRCDDDWRQLRLFAFCARDIISSYAHAEPLTISATLVTIIAHQYPPRSTAFIACMILRRLCSRQIGYVYWIVITNTQYMIITSSDLISDENCLLCVRTIIGC